MYVPKQNENQSYEDVKAFIRTHGFAILTSQVNNRPWATHLPLELVTIDGKDFLEGHLAKANKQWKHFDKNEGVLCIFNGPHAYISSSWYQKEEVPTWDYIAVHVYGKIHIVNETETMSSLNRLVDKYEAGQKNPISLDQLSPKTLRQVKGVVGFLISIDEYKAAYKLSQGRPGDHGRICQELNRQANSDSKAIAKAICPHFGQES